LSYENEKLYHELQILKGKIAVIEKQIVIIFNFMEGLIKNAKQD